MQSGQLEDCRPIIGLYPHLSFGRAAAREPLFLGEAAMALAIPNCASSVSVTMTVRARPISSGVPWRYWLAKRNRLVLVQLHPRPWCSPRKLAVRSTCRRDARSNVARSRSIAWTRLDAGQRHREQPVAADPQIDCDHFSENLSKLPRGSSPGPLRFNPSVNANQRYLKFPSQPTWASWSVG